MTAMPKCLSPDEIVNFILESLCVCGFNGVELAQIWTLCEDKINPLDDFYKTLIWTWLMGDKYFKVFVIDDGKKKPKNSHRLPLKLVSKDTFITYQDLCNQYEEGKIRFKADEDKQSIYLTGVPLKNNSLGQMPYELLMHIAKSRGHGITSVDLIKESGQDKRSLTSRLNVLEDHKYIQKTPTIASGVRTYVMVHFRFRDNFENIPVRFEKYDMMQNVMIELGKAPNGVRVISDLMKQVGADNNRYDRRRFHSIIRSLGSKGFLEEIVVVHEETQKTFVGAKLLKKLPPDFTQKEIKAQFNSLSPQKGEKPVPTDSDTKQESASISNEGVLYNKIFPLPNQIYDLVKSERGISATDIEVKINGKYRTRVFASALNGCTVESPIKGESHQIIRQLCYESKQRFFRMYVLRDFVQLDCLNMSDYISDTPPKLDGIFTKSLVEISAEEVKSQHKRRCRLFDPDSAHPLFFWSSYRGKLLRKHASPVRKVDEFKSGDDKLVLSIRKSGVRVVKKDTNFEQMAIDNALLQPVVGEEDATSSTERRIAQLATSGSEVSNELPPSVATLVQNVYTDNPVELSESTERTEKNKEDGNSVNKKRIPIFVDKGPRARRKVLSELVNSKGYQIFNGDLCKKISKAMSVDYLIDRRTVIKDAIYLESNGKVRIVKKGAPGKKVLTILFTVDERMTEAKVEKVFRHYQNLPILKARHHIKGEKIDFQKVKFFKKPNLTLKLRKSKKVDKEKRLRKSRIGILKSRYLFEHGEKRLKRKSSALEAEPSEHDLLKPLMRNKKRKKLSVRNKHVSSATHPGMKKKRTSVKLDRKYIMLYIRGVIISQSLSTGQNIEWPRVAALFGGRYTAEMLRRQWPRHKRMMGFRGLQQARRNWENALLSAVETGKIKEDDLLDYDLKKLIDIWQEEDPDFVANRTNFVLYSDYDLNLKNTSFKLFHLSRSDELFKDALSIIDKEVTYANASFTYPIDSTDEERQIEGAIVPSELEKAKSKLKALFATGANDFSSDKARKLFPDSSSVMYSKALSELEDEKAIAFLGEDSKIKFTLTDKLLSIADCKMDDAFFKNAANLYDTLEQIVGLKKGIVLSKTSNNGCFAALYNLFAYNMVQLTRVDQAPPSLKSYSTKSQDRRKLESDFVISDLVPFTVHTLQKVSVPVGPPCSRLWINLDGKFNGVLWTRSVCALIWCIVFRPGVRLLALCQRMAPFLEKFEVRILLDWLVERRVARKGAYGGYWIQPSWFLALKNEL